MGRKGRSAPNQTITHDPPIVAGLSSCIGVGKRGAACLSFNARPTRSGRFDSLGLPSIGGNTLESQASMYVNTTAGDLSPYVTRFYGSTHDTLMPQTDVAADLDGLIRDFSAYKVPNSDPLGQSSALPNSRTFDRSRVPTLTITGPSPEDPADAIPDHIPRVWTAEDPEHLQTDTSGFAMPIGLQDELAQWDCSWALEDEGLQSILAGPGEQEVVFEGQFHQALLPLESTNTDTETSISNLSASAQTVSGANQWLAPPLTRWTANPTAPATASGAAVSNVLEADATSQATCPVPVASWSTEETRTLNSPPSFEVPVGRWVTADDIPLRYWTKPPSRNWASLGHGVPTAPPVSTASGGVVGPRATNPLSSARSSTEGGAAQQPQQPPAGKAAKMGFYCQRSSAFTLESRFSTGTGCGRVKVRADEEDSDDGIIMIRPGDVSANDRDDAGSGIQKKSADGHVHRHTQGTSGIKEKDKSRSRETAFTSASASKRSYRSGEKTHGGASFATRIARDSHRERRAALTAAEPRLASKFSDCIRPSISEGAYRNDIEPHRRSVLAAASGSMKRKLIGDHDGQGVRDSKKARARRENATQDLMPHGRRAGRHMSSTRLDMGIENRIPSAGLGSVRRGDETCDSSSIRGAPRLIKEQNAQILDKSVVHRHRETAGGLLHPPRRSDNGGDGLIRRETTVVDKARKERSRHRPTADNRQHDTSSLTKDRLVGTTETSCSNSHSNSGAVRTSKWDRESARKVTTNGTARRRVDLSLSDKPRTAEIIDSRHQADGLDASAPAPAAATTTSSTKLRAESTRRPLSASNLEAGRHHHHRHHDRDQDRIRSTLKPPTHDTAATNQTSSSKQVHRRQDPGRFHNTNVRRSMAPAKRSRVQTSSAAPLIDLTSD